MLDQLIKDALDRALRRIGSKTAIAEAAGVSRAGLTNFMNGRCDIKNMTLDTFQKLAPVLELDVVDKTRRPEQLSKCLFAIIEAWPEVDEKSKRGLESICEIILQANEIQGPV